jgi:homoserine dehydrogenase
MTEIKIALLGLGNVGRAFADYLERVNNDLPVGLKICGIADSSGGFLSDDSSQIKQAIEAKTSGRSISDFSSNNSILNTQEFVDHLQQSGISVLVESLPTNIINGQPVLDYLKTALASGVSVATVDKGPLVHGLEALKEAARAGSSRLAFSGTTGVTPPEEIGDERVLEIRGILNGTTNHILTEMQTRSISFDQALSEAQEAGIAEPDPKLDTEGWDTAVKILILAKSLMGAQCGIREVSRIGIGPEIDTLIEKARPSGRIVRLVGRARIWQGRVRVSVAPKLITEDSPFYNVSGTSKVAVFRTEKGEALSHGISARDAISQTILNDIISLS